MRLKLGMTGWKDRQMRLKLDMTGWRDRQMRSKLGMTGSQLSTSMMMRLPSKERPGKVDNAGSHKTMQAAPLLHEPPSRQRFLSSVDGFASVAASAPAAAAADQIATCQ